MNFESLFTILSTKKIYESNIFKANILEIYKKYTNGDADRPLSDFFAKSGNESLRSLYRNFRRALLVPRLKQVV